jgi:pimeloyl-ACP methyl ester carboxylesterase
MPFISVRDIQIYYEVSGKGPRLLYISGTGADLRNKPNIFDSPLTDHFEILAFDQRGLGQTERPDIRYSMEDYASDAVELLTALDWALAMWWAFRLAAWWHRRSPCVMANVSIDWCFAVPAVVVPVGAPTPSMKCPICPQTK